MPVGKNHEDDTKFHDALSYKVSFNTLPSSLEFITVLVPSDEYLIASSPYVAYNNTELQNGVAKYTAIIDTDNQHQDPPVSIVTACHDENSNNTQTHSCSDYYISITTDADLSVTSFLRLSAAGQFLGLTKTTILHEGNTIACNGTTVLEAVDCAADIAFDEAMLTYDTANGVVKADFLLNENVVQPLKIRFHRSGCLLDEDCIASWMAHLAYDDEYFYINYEWADLPHTDDLVLCKGEYSFSYLTHDLTIDGDVSLTRQTYMTVPIIYGLTVQPGSTINFLPNTCLRVLGTLVALGTSDKEITFCGNEGWTGIRVLGCGTADLEHCRIRDAYCGMFSDGSLHLSDSSIFNCDFGCQVIGGYCDITDNLIYQTTEAGLDIGPTTGSSVISGNSIRENEIGVVFHSSTIDFLENHVYWNNVAGVRLEQNSTPYIEGNYFGENPMYLFEEDVPEIYLLANPVSYIRENDIVFRTDGVSFYYQSSGTYPAYTELMKNWWDCDDASDIIKSIDPPVWEQSGVINVLPLLAASITEFVPEPLIYPLSSFEQGYALESSGDLTAAATAYMEQISTEPDSVEALWSLNRLTHCVADTSGINLYTLQGYYDDIAADSTAYPELFKAARLNSTYCDRLAGQYSAAIDDYLVMLDEAETVIDSLMTELDIVNTYEQSNMSGGRAAVNVVSHPAITLTSMKEAAELRQDIYDRLKEITASSRVFAPAFTTPQVQQNFPNPFNPETTIKFTLPQDVHVELAVYNIRGQRVRTLMNDDLVRGYHSVVWDGRNEGGKPAASGIYFYRLSTGKWSTTRKMLLLK